MRAGIFIGVSQYHDARISNLNFAHLDAKNLLNQLIETSGFSLQESKVLGSFKNSKNINLAPSENADNRRASKETIIDQLAEFKNVAELETFVFFFSGHGFRSQDGHDYLIPSHATTADLEDTSIRLSKIIKACCKVNARNVLILIDACRNNFPSHLSVQPIDTNLDLGSLSETRLAIIFSTQAKEKSYESEDISAGLFTHTICKTLELEFDCFTTHDIYRTIKTQLPILCKKLGKTIQNPHGFFLDETAREHIIAISKLTKKLDMPSHIRSEMGREDIDFIQDCPYPLVIDFGTTKSVLAYKSQNVFSFAKDKMGRVCVPSTVKIGTTGEYEIGVDWFAEPTSRYSKRNILDHDLLSRTTGTISPDHFAVLIIKSLIRNFEEKSRLKARTCILSIPSDYNILEVSRIIDCAQAAGVRVTRVVPEPTAASLNIISDFLSKNNNKTERSVVVVDMGGGTLDVAFVVAILSKYTDQGNLTQRKNKVLLKILATSGEARLGGLDFNEKLRKYLIDIILDKYPIDKSILTQDVLMTLDREIERVKTSLSTELNAYIQLSDIVLIDGRSTNIRVQIDRDLFNTISNHLIRQFKHCVKHCIEHGVLWEDEVGDIAVAANENVDTVIIAGQSGKLPAFRNHLQSKFPNAKIIDHYSDTAVARGLSYLAYEKELPIVINDIAHTYIGIYGVRRFENVLVMSTSFDHEQVIYPTDTTPLKSGKNIEWSSNEISTITITTNTIGKQPEPICEIEIDPKFFYGSRGKIYISVDRMMTVAIEIHDFKQNKMAWQINNFFTVPYGFKSVGDINSKSSKRSIMRILEV